MSEFGLPVADKSVGILPSSSSSAVEEIIIPQIDNIVLAEAMPAPEIVVAETVLFDPVEVEREFKACLKSGREHRELFNPNDKKLKDVCYDTIHLSLLEAIAQTDY